MPITDSSDYIPKDAPWYIDLGEKEWYVQLKGVIGNGHFELSVLHKNNYHGRISFGWGGANKIILFSTGLGGNRLDKENEAFAMEVAKRLCDALNEP